MSTTRQYIVKDEGASASYFFEASERELLKEITLIVVHPDSKDVRSIIDQNTFSIKNELGTYVANNWDVDYIAPYDGTHSLYRLKALCYDEAIGGRCDVSFNNWSHIVPPVGATRIVVITKPQP